jgi:hypothetical protein
MLQTFKYLAALTLLLTAGVAAAAEEKDAGIAKEEEEESQAAKEEQAAESEEERLPIYSEKRYLIDLCDAHPDDKQCEALHQKTRRATRHSLSTLCKHDPLHKRCIQERDRKLNALLEVERFCNQTPDKKRCDSLRRRKNRK